MTAPQAQYPFDLAGDDAPPPEPVPADLVQAWRDHEAAEAADLEDGPLVAAAGNWRMARSLQVLLAEADAANPRRDKTSDGGIGDPRHQSRGKASDHNPWVILAGVGVVRARDFDVDGLDVVAAAERMRVAAYRDKAHPLRGGGYLILNGRITRPDFSGWAEYTGENPHVTILHVSVSTDPERFDSERPWHVWTEAPAPTARPRPTTPRQDPPAPTAAPGRDLTGRGAALRGDQGDTGPRVRGLQRFLVLRYPLYARGLAADGVWGPRTSAVLAEFARRSRVPGADGRNIGPRIARALYLAGFRG
jgi:hypothetical protein